MAATMQGHPHLFARLTAGLDAAMYDWEDDDDEAAAPPPAPTSVRGRPPIAV